MRTWLTNVAELDSETIDSIESGLRTNRPGWSGEITLFYMKKSDIVFRDTDGFNVSGGRSRHRGVELRFVPTERVHFGLQWTTIGKYYLDAENRFEYPGHALLHFRTGIRLSAGLDLNLRLNNIADEAVADRADFGRGDYRYLPGRGRELFVELRYVPGGGR